MFLSVGRGTGPDTVAPVRWAVSTISRAARSMASWSYALRRIRILFVASVATGSSFRLSRREGAPPLSWGAAPVVSVTSKRRPIRSNRPLCESLLDDLGNDSRANGATAFADREPKTLVHGDRLNQIDLHLDVVPRHHHLRALGQVGDAGDVRRAEVELRAVAREERGVTTALLLLQAVDLRLELRVRGDRARLAQDLPALDLLALGPPQQTAGVVARLPLVEVLVEHLDPGHDRLLGRSDADDLDLVAGVDDPLL